MSNPALVLRGIRKSYYGNVVLQGVDLEVRAGEIHALVGENGAGKSTLMNILFGMPVIHETGGFEGTIELGGTAVVPATPSDAMAHGVGMVHQEFMLLPGFGGGEHQARAGTIQAERRESVARSLGERPRVSTSSG
ncbi:MAG: ATP-binding cassette domain-containing protein [Candidatus Eisenbacteria bacterium]